MFRQIAGSIPTGANVLFLQHPSVLSTLLEVAWSIRPHDANRDLGLPQHRSDILAIPGSWLATLTTSANITTPTGLPPALATILAGTNWNLALSHAHPSVFWEHLIYAYMIENTRIYEVFRRVLNEFLHGEKLGVPSEDSQHWLRNTEELFYSDPPPFSITNVSSHIRPDMRAARRNAYGRMFGMDLNHGNDDNQPYPFVRAEATNREFASTFEEFLREVWVAYVNMNNFTGANPTDPGKLTNLVEKLREMLLARRMNGNLSREEFTFVSMMSWFHLTVEFDSPIVVDLRAVASSPEQRLFKIAERVGLPAHGLSASYFDIADDISAVLILIEAVGTAIVPSLQIPGNLVTAMNNIITHWSLITGRDMKAGKVAST
jgi:hypothetical protein